MRLKMIASILSMFLLSACLCALPQTTTIKNETKPARCQPRPCRICTSWNPLPKRLSRKRLVTPFSITLGVNVLLLSTARGSGLAVNGKTKQETFMKMGSVGAGLGMGVKDYVVVFVFENDKALAQFLNSGWSGSAQADAAAKVGDKGGAHSGAAEVSPGVWVYQITKNGLALQLTLQGTKYYKDDKLNNAAKS